MITFTKKILQNDAYKRLITNILSLFSLQGFTYIIPLITFPYLTRVVGPENFGLIAFATAFIGYFQILSDYGFNLSATREISIYRENEESISKIFNSVMASKFLLLVLSFIIMTFIVFSFDIFRENWLLYFFTFGLILGNFLLPTWLFLGMERIKYISILKIGTLVIYLIMILTFVRQPSDYIYVPLINSIGAIAAGIMGLVLVHKYFNIKFALPSTKDIKLQMEKGWHLFISQIAISLYSTTNTFILGFFAPLAIVGYYAVAQTIMISLQGLITPIGNAIYPYFSKIQSEDHKRAKIELKKLLLIIGVISFLLSVILAIFSPLIIKILAGQLYLPSIQILQVLVFILFAVGVNNVLGIQGLVAFGHEKRFFQIVMFAGIFHIILLISLILLLGSIGAAIAVISTEIIIAILEYVVLRRLKLL